MNTKIITKISLCTACLALSAFVSIPLGFTPAMVTLQTLIVNVMAILLTPLQSLAAMVVYILLGLFGLPIFSGGVGGPAKLFGPTGGYILAFLIGTPVMSLTKTFFLEITGKFIKKPAPARIFAYTINAVIVGMTIIYGFGSLYMKLVTAKAWGAVFLAAVVPFIPLDIIKCIAAGMIAVPIEKAIK